MQHAAYFYVIISRTNAASVGSVFNDTRKLKVLLLPETIKEKLLTPDEGPSLETSIFPLSFQLVREPLTLLPILCSLLAVTSHFRKCNWQTAIIVMTYVKLFCCF